MAICVLSLTVTAGCHRLAQEVFVDNLLPGASGSFQHRRAGPLNAPISGMMPPCYQRCCSVT